MHGLRGGEERNGRRRHMWPVPPAPGTPSKPAAIASSVADSVQTSPDCFLKDGRQIRVGDCALFQAGGAPPFIGIIRRFVTSKEDYLKLCVNWLYRPADAKLAKGILLDAAPNEVFYSFHKDVIAAASLLHPCKVAFLRKGVDLPSGISSFVCRRVYDFENKCLWWLTDQDYINERQEEVDQLLDKTRLEMHAAVQSGGRSPKRLNGPASTQQLKSGADSGTSFPSQVKGKKRDRSDQVTESIKRERSIKKEDVDSGNLRFDALMKAEITKITDKGGLTNPEGVDKLVHLMQLDRADRKIDLAGRILLADVIAATERNECLNRFVQLRAVTVLDYWLQEAHKGKSGDGSSPKDGDKAAEELLFALLRALDKLPISLHALQNCHIGKSVNNLRSHKNPEIQKKARGLVDTWKKRVDAEIKVNDAKALASSQAVHWPGKPGFAEVPDALNKHAVSGDVTVKSSIIQPSTCRALPSKPGHGDAIVKSTPVTIGSLKLPSSFPASGAISSKDSLPTAVGSSGNSDLPHMVTKEEKSSSSSQSLNNSQSCSSDLIKTMGSSWKEDARSSTARSMSAGKSSSGSSRHRRSNNGFPGNSVSGIQKVTNLGKSGSLARATTLDKVPQGLLTCERSLDVPVSDQGNGHRLIIRLPNQGRGPPQAVAAGSSEDPSIIGSRASSPSNPDKHDNNDRKIKVRGDRSNIAADINAESRQSIASKVLAGCDEIDQSTTANHDDDPRSCDQKEKSMDGSKIICTSGNEKGSIHIDSKPRNAFSSMNALIESCVKHSEASATMSSGDDIGINLLASVAAGEISKSDLVSSTASPGSSPVMDEPHAGKSEAKSRLSCDTSAVQSNGLANEIADVHSEKNGVFAGSLLARKDSQEMGTSSSGDKKTLPEYKIGEHIGLKPVSNITLHKATDSCIKSEEKLEDEKADKNVSVCTPADVKEEMESDEVRQYQNMRKNSVYGASIPSSCKLKIRTSLTDENISTDCCEKVSEGEMIPEDNKQIPNLNRCRNESTTSDRNSEKMVVSEALSCLPFDNNGLCGGASNEHQMTPVTEKTHAENEDLRGDGTSSITEKLLRAECADSKTGNLNCLQVSHVEPIDSQRKEHLSNCAPSSNDENAGSVRTPVATTDGVEESVDRKEVAENYPVGSTKVESSPTHPPQEVDRGTKSTGSKLSGADADRADEAVSSAEASSVSVVAAHPDTPVKIDFDLNEGITGDDGNQSEPASSPVVVCSPAVHLPCLSSFSACSIPNGSTATITVAAPAKGSFIPPENLCKAEPGWKGSAATSAFRPAEPRKVLEMPLTTIDVPSSSVAAGKRKRPLFDIDLNVPDEQSLDDMVSQSSAQTTGSESGVVGNRDGAARSSGGLDLDLNLVGEGGENGQFLGSTGCRLDRSVLPARPASRGQPIVDVNTSRDFDLNNGPGFDEVGTTDSLPRNQYAKINSTVPILPSITSLRVNNPEFGSVSSWFPPGNSYPAVTIPSFLPDRGDYPYPFAAPTGSQRIMGSVTGGSTFAGDIYRGPVLSSSPAMAFSSATPFPYAGFQFGTSFPVASTSFSGVSTSYADSSPGRGSCYPAIPSQFVGPSGALSSHYPRPYLLSLPEGSNSGGSDSSRRRTRQGLDLNAGPGNGDADVKDDRVPSALRLQHPVASSQAFVEEQARLYQVPGGALKRKEPEGGWDADRFSGYKQHSWQ